MCMLWSFNLIVCGIPNFYFLFFYIIFRNFIYKFPYWIQTSKKNYFLKVILFLIYKWHTPGKHGCRDNSHGYVHNLNKRVILLQLNLHINPKHMVNNFSIFYLSCSLILFLNFFLTWKNENLQAKITIHESDNPKPWR